MGRNSPSIKSRRACRSPCLPSLLAGLLITAGPAHAWVATLSTHTLSSHGLVHVDHWVERPLEGQSYPVDVIVRKELALSRPVSFGELTLSHSTRGFYKGDANVLTAMALNARPGAFPLPADGRYPLHALTQQLVSNDLTLSRVFRPATALALEGRVRLSYVLDYQRSEGQAELQVVARDARLQGQIHRWGTRRYGFLIDDRDDAGQGLGLDARLQWQPGDWQVQAKVENLVSRLRLHPMHFSVRQYDVRARDGELVIREGDAFSMIGTYGLTRGHERLPSWAQLSLGHASWPGVQGGLLKLNRHWMPWLAYRTPPSTWQWGISTVAGRNLTVDGLWRSGQGLQWGLGLTWTADGRAAVGQMHIRWPL